MNFYLVVEVVFVYVILVDVETKKVSDSINMDRFQFPGFVTSLVIV